MNKLQLQKKLRLFWDIRAKISPALKKKSKEVICIALENLPPSLTKTLKKFKTLELSVFVTTKPQMKTINHAFRNKNKPTDVLSFARRTQFNKNIYSLGDILICQEVAKKQAKTNKISFEEEFLTLLVHGFLHNWGYDHEKNAKEAKKMFSLQDKILERIKRY